MTPSAHAEGEAITGADRAGRWSIAGAAAGIMMVACMLVLRVLTGVPALPDLFQDQVIALLPGSVFGFVLDRLQFAAKPLLLVGLASVGVPGGAALGWLYGRAWPRWRWLERHSLAGGSAYGLVVWLVLELSVAVWGDGPGAAITSSGLLLASVEVYGIGLVGLARILEVPRDLTGPRVPVVDRGRRLIVLGGLTGGAVVLAAGAFDDDRRPSHSGQLDRSHAWSLADSSVSDQGHRPTTRTKRSEGQRRAYPLREARVLRR